MAEKPNYFKQAATHPAHRLLLVVGGLASVVAAWNGKLLVLVLFVVVEALALLVLPRLPAFRRACDEKARAEVARQRAIERERIASRLSPNAKSRLDGIARTRTKILDSMNALSTSGEFARLWTPKLDEAMTAALRILVAVDAIRADTRDERFLASEVEDLAAEAARLAPGPARTAKEQHLALARKRLADFARLAESRDAAVTQLEMLEDLLQDLLARNLSERDASAFGARLDTLTSQIDAAGETVGMLDRHAETEAALAALRA